MEKIKWSNNRNGKLLKKGQKIPTTQDGIDWFLQNGYGDENKKEKA